MVVEGGFVPFLTKSEVEPARQRRGVFVDHGRDCARPESGTANPEGGELDSASNQLRTTEREGRSAIEPLVPIQLVNLHRLQPVEVHLHYHLARGDTHDASMRNLAPMRNSNHSTTGNTILEG